MGGVEHAGPEVAGDAVARDEPLDQRLRLLGELPQEARALAADAALERRLAEALAGAELAAVAPRRPGADPRRLEQHRVVAALGEVQQRREPGVAAADDADVGAHPAGERRMRRHRLRGRDVVGIRMIRRWHRFPVTWAGACLVPPRALPVEREATAGAPR